MGTFHIRCTIPNSVDRTKSAVIPKILFDSLIAWVGIGVGTALQAAEDRTADARAILRQAAESLEDLRGGPDAGTLLQIAAAQAKAGDRDAAGKMFQRAIAAFKVMDDEDIVGKRMIQSAIVEAQAQAGDIAGAVETAALLDEYRRGYNLNRIATIQAEAGDIPGAFRTADGIKGEEGSWKATAFEGIASAQADGGNFAGALRTAELIKDIPAEGEEAQKMRAATRFYALFNIATAQARSGKVAEALQTVDLLGPEPAIHRARALQEIAKLRAATGDVKEAVQIADQIALKEHKAWTLVEIAKSQAMAGELQSARETLSGAIRLDPSIELHEQCSNELYLAALAAEAQAKAGKLQIAMANARDVTNDELKSGVLREIATAQIKAGDLVEAVKTLEQAIQHAVAITDNYRAASVLRDIASAQAKAGDHDAAKQTFQRAVQAAAVLEVGGGTNVIMLWDIGLAQAKSGDRAAAAKSFERARETARAYEDESYVAVLFQDIAKAQTQGGDQAGALAWARNERSSIIKTLSLLGVAQGLLPE